MQLQTAQTRLIPTSVAMSFCNVSALAFLLFTGPYTIGMCDGGNSCGSNATFSDKFQPSNVYSSKHTKLTNIAQQILYLNTTLSTVSPIPLWTAGGQCYRRLHFSWHITAKQCNIIDIYMMLKIVTSLVIFLFRCRKTCTFNSNIILYPVIYFQKSIKFIVWNYKKLWLREDLLRPMTLLTALLT